MLSMTMSLAGSGIGIVTSRVQNPRPVSQGGVIVTKVRATSINVVEKDEKAMSMKMNEGDSGNNGRREVVLGVAMAAAAAAACSLSKIAMAEEEEVEPKRGTAEAKKKYARLGCSLGCMRTAGWGNGIAVGTAKTTWFAPGYETAETAAGWIAAWTALLLFCTTAWSALLHAASWVGCWAVEDTSWAIGGATGWAVGGVIGWAVGACVGAHEVVSSGHIALNSIHRRGGKTSVGNSISSPNQRMMTTVLF